VSVEEPLVAVWPAAASAGCADALQGAVRIERERDLDQDVDFGLRQLTDTAVKAMSPGINDPTTARTCVGYVRSILVLLAERRFPEPVRRFPGRALTVVVRRREFDEHLAALEEIGRHAGGDPRVAGAVLDALASVCDSAARAGIEPRAAAAAETAASLVAAG
jgi:uncharacterized membrane protein